jgi:hypothetical protein
MPRETILVERIVSPRRYQAVLDSHQGLLANDQVIHRVNCPHLRRYSPERCVNNSYQKLYTPLEDIRVLESVLEASGKEHHHCI